MSGLLSDLAGLSREGWLALLVCLAVVAWVCFVAATLLVDLALGWLRELRFQAMWGRILRRHAVRRGVRL